MAEPPPLCTFTYEQAMTCGQTDLTPTSLNPYWVVFFLFFLPSSLHSVFMFCSFPRCHILPLCFPIFSELQLCSLG